MVEHRTWSVILSYSEDRQRLNVHMIDAEKVAPVIAGKLEMPIPLDEFDFTLDDEFARLLGIAMLSMIAFGQPALKQYMSVTSAPVLRVGD